MKLYKAKCFAECPEGLQNNSGVCEPIPPPTDCTPGCTSALFNNELCNQECNVLDCAFDNG
jgi:hypothetical protein